MGLIVIHTSTSKIHNCAEIDPSAAAQGVEQRLLMHAVVLTVIAGNDLVEAEMTS